MEPVSDKLSIPKLVLLVIVLALVSNFWFMGVWFQHQRMNELTTSTTEPVYLEASPGYTPEEVAGGDKLASEISTSEVEQLYAADDIETAAVAVEEPIAASTEIEGAAPPADDSPLYAFEPSATLDAIEVTATQMSEEYESDAALASQTYDGREVIVTGTITLVSTSIVDTPYVELDGGDVAWTTNVLCYFSREQVDQLNALATNQEIRIRGTVRGRTFNVLVEECSIQD